MNKKYTKLVRFNLSLPMGFLDSATYYCIETNAVTNLENSPID